MSFAALTVVGDGDGAVGMGKGKGVRYADEVVTIKETKKK